VGLRKRRFPRALQRCFASRCWRWGGRSDDEGLAGSEGRLAEMHKGRALGEVDVAATPSGVGEVVWGAGGISRYAPSTVRLMALMPPASGWGGFWNSLSCETTALWKRSGERCAYGWWFLEKLIRSFGGGCVQMRAHREGAYARAAHRLGMAYGVSQHHGPTAPR
jgi:hypothetical protein